MNVAALRKRLLLTQDKLAEIIGVSANTIRRWESGAVHPRAGHLKALKQLAQKRWNEV